MQGPKAWLFLLSPNNSGSTLLAQIIAQSPNVYLPPFGNHEGQMAPGVRQYMRNNHWSAEQAMPWPLIKQRWSTLFDDTKEVFLEKSPPNIVRAAEIAANFPDASYIVSISDPYSHCGSCWYRYTKSPARPEQFAAIARGWVMRAKSQQQNLLLLPHCLRTTYEDVCRDPRGFAAAVNGYMPLLAIPERDDYEVEVKGRHGGVVNYNARNILTIEREGLAAANEVFARHERLLAFFGYRLLTPDDYDRLGEAYPDDLAAARRRREQQAMAAAGPN